MPFLIWRHRQRSIDKGDDRWRKFRCAAIANPLRIAAVSDEARGLKGCHVTGHPGLAGAEFPHQFANAMLAAIPHQPEGFEPRRLCEGR